MMKFKRIFLISLLFLSLFSIRSALAEFQEREIQIDLTAEERAFLAGKKLRLGVDVARPPFEYIDEKGEYTGISAEFIIAAAKKLGITIVPQKDIKWTEAMEKVKIGEIDVIPKVTPSAAREKFMIFTRPYTTFPSVIITRKDRLAGGIDDLRGVKVGVNKGQIIEVNLKRDYPELSLVTYPGIETGLRALSTGKCDAYIDNLGAVAYTIDTIGLTNLRIAASTPYTHDLAFGVRKDWPLLASALDKALAGMTDQEKSEIKNRWLSIKYDAGINWRIFGPIGISMLIIIAFVLIWNRRLKKAVRERERSEQEIKAMGEAMPDALVMIDGQGKVLFWNKAAEMLFGYNTAEAMGMDFHSTVVPPDNIEQAQAGIKKFRETGQGILFGSVVETTAINRTGKAFPVEVNLSPFQIGEKWFAVGTVRDITERKQMDEKLEKSTEDLQNQIGELGKTRKAMLNILEDVEIARRDAESNMHKMNAMSQAVNDALVMINGRGKVLFWNQAAENMFGYTSAEAMGMDFHEMCAPPEVREKAHAGISQFAATGQGVLFGAARETIAINRTDQAFPVEINLSPFQVDNEWFAVGTVRDITERRRADALKVGKEVAEEAAARAEKAKIEAERAQEELKAKVLEIERFNRLSLGREVRIIDLKKQINALAVKAGEKKIYQEHELTGEQEEELAQTESSVPESEQAPIGPDALTDALNLEQFQLLLTDFCKAVGIASAIIDLNGKILASARWQRVCTDFHRINEKTLARCIESDTELALNLKEGKSFSVYRCKNGLTDAASPIIVFGRHIANVFVGQFFSTPPDLELFRLQAVECGMDTGQYLEAIKEVPIVNEENLESILDFLVGMAQVVASMSMESNRARQAEASNVRRIEESKMVQAAAMSLAEDADQARKEIEQYKGRLEILVQERTEELRTTEERSRLLLESAGEGIFGVDAMGQITFINPAALTMLGFSEEELRGRKVHAITHHSREDGSHYPVEKCPMYASYTTGIESHVTDEVLWRKDGLCFPVEYSSTPMTKDGKVMGAVVTFRDTTERKQAEKELKERMEDLERFSRLTINREGKMIQLKEEINTLLKQAGKEKKYKIVV